jgi:hypothetical protein
VVLNPIDAQDDNASNANTWHNSSHRYSWTVTEVRTKTHKDTDNFLVTVGEATG